MLIGVEPALNTDSLVHIPPVLVSANDYHQDNDIDDDDDDDGDGFMMMMMMMMVLHRWRL